jgi:hypothetical protein
VNTCVAFATDPNNCGSCGHVCNLPNASSTCSGSACQVLACTPGFSNCDGVASNGCESNPQTDNNNCGACGNVCGAGTTCCAGSCVSVGGACLPGGNDCLVGQEQCVGSSVTCVQTATVPDGSICGPGIGGVCCGAVCVAGNLFCTDGDGDGQGDFDGNIDFECPGVSPPAGFAPTCDDCCGHDAHAFKGSTWCDSNPRIICGGFDYNCSGVEEKVLCTNHVVTTGAVDCQNTVSQCLGSPPSCTAVCTSPGAGQNCDGACSWTQSNACGSPISGVSLFCDSACQPGGTGSGPLPTNQSCQ